MDGPPHLSPRRRPSAACWCLHGTTFDGDFTSSWWTFTANKEPDRSRGFWYRLASYRHRLWRRIVKEIIAFPSLVLLGIGSKHASMILRLAFLPGCSCPYRFHVLRDRILWSSRAGVRLRFLHWKGYGNGCLYLAPRSLRGLLLQKSLSLLNELLPALGIADRDSPVVVTVVRHEKGVGTHR